MPKRISKDLGVGRKWRQFDAGTYDLTADGPTGTQGRCARRLVPKSAGSFTMLKDSGESDFPIDSFPTNFVHDADTSAVTSDVAFVAYW